MVNLGSCIQTIHLGAYLNGEKLWAAKMEYNAWGRKQGICYPAVFVAVGRPVFHEVSIQQAGDSKRQGSFGNVTGYSETDVGADMNVM